MSNHTENHNPPEVPQTITPEEQVDYANEARRFSESTLLVTNDLDHRIKELKTSNDSLEVMFKQYMKDIHEIKSDIRVMKKDLSEMKDEMIEVKKDLSQMKDEMIEVKKEIKNNSSSIINIKNILAAGYSGEIPFASVPFLDGSTTGPQHPTCQTKLMKRSNVDSMRRPVLENYLNGYV